ILANQGYYSERKPDHTHLQRSCEQRARHPAPRTLFFWIAAAIDCDQPVAAKSASCKRGGRVLGFYLNCFSSHMNRSSPPSSGSFHLSSTAEQSTTSGLRKSSRASLYSQFSLTFGSMFSRISSMLPCCLIRSMARLGPMPLMVPQ
uniref:Uncharacterized protein n=1 Tax=Hippocampus comes TaxID=109280 RepID=A0A3Q2XHT5_HIPCM